MNTRTMRREVYEAHEMMRKSQIRKRCISRCRRAFLRKLKNVGIAVILVAVAVAAIANGIDNASTASVEKQAKTVASIPKDTNIALLENPFTPTYYVSTLSAQLVNYSQGPVEGGNGLLMANASEVDDEDTSTEDEDTQETETKEEPTVEKSEPVIMEEVTSKREETNEIVVEPKPEVETPEEHEVVTCDTVLEFPVVGADGYSYTEEDYKYLLMIIVGESQNCSKEHQMYVGSVVLNRLHNKKYFSYADCIKDIALAPNQYTCFNGPNAYRDPTDLNIEVAKELILYGSVLPSNVIFQAQFKQGQGVYIQLGNTYFCWKD